MRYGYASLRPFTPSMDTKSIALFIKIQLKNATTYNKHRNKYSKILPLSNTDPPKVGNKGQDHRTAFLP